MKFQAIKKQDKKIIKQNEVHLRAMASVGILPKTIIADFARVYCGMSKVESDKLCEEEQAKFKCLQLRKTSTKAVKKERAMRIQPIKKVGIDTWTSEFNSFVHRFTIGSIEDNYCPQDVIDQFWNKYIVFGCQDLLFQMKIAANIGIERSGCFSKNKEDIDVFFTDLHDLFIALYLQNRYNRSKQKIIFVKDEEDGVV